ETVHRGPWVSPRRPYAASRLTDTAIGLEEWVLMESATDGTTTRKDGAAAMSWDIALDRPPRAQTTDDAGIAVLVDLYRGMSAARRIDEVEAELVKAGEAFFHVAGAGHEGMAALSRHLTPDDWLHLHYRDKALMLARGVAPAMFFHSLLCNAASHSAGRQMS